MSGKAMQETVPPAGTAIWEVSQTLEESEGHAFVRPLLLLMKEALLKPKLDEIASVLGRPGKGQ